MKLTNVQKELLLDVCESDERTGNLLNTIGFRVFIATGCNLSILEKSWNLIVQNYDSLRIRISDRKQKIISYEEIGLPTVCVDGLQGMEELQTNLMNEPIYYNRGQLWRAILVDCGSTAGGMIVQMHHLCSDGYTIELLAAQLEKCYFSLLNGNEPEIKAESYASVLDAEKLYLNSVSFREDKNWWKQEYSRQKKYSIPAGYTYGSKEAASLSIEIDGDRYTKLKQFCKEQGCSISSYLMSIAALTTAVISGKVNFAIYCLLNGRETWKEKLTAGCMVRTIPVFYDVRQNETVAEMVTRETGFYMESLRHGKLPFYKHVELSFVKSLRCGFNFHHNWLLFSFMRLGKLERNSQIGFKVLENPIISSLMYCAVYDIPEDLKLSMILFYRKNIFSTERIKRVADVFSRILSESLDVPGSKVSELLKG